MLVRTGLRLPTGIFAIAVACGLAACTGGGAVQRTVPLASQLSVPAPPPMTMIPPSPSFAVPPRPSSVGVHPVTATTHAVFFTGEASLGNGVYYLAFPNSSLFGYYSYLSDTHYVYHFDMSYEYVFDSSDANNVYFYDFQTGDFWYTGANLFPYVYDFTLQSFLYYYPDTQRSGHYTTNPRFFYNYQTSKIIQLPAPSIPLLLNLTIHWANHGNSASSIAVTLNVFDVNGHQLGNLVKNEIEQPQNNGSGVPSQNTDNLSVSYPQGQGATYQIIVNNPPTVPSPCTISGGSGSVVDANSGNANAYPTVILTCS